MLAAPLLRRRIPSLPCWTGSIRWASDDGTGKGDGSRWYKPVQQGRRVPRPKARNGVNTNGQDVKIEEKPPIKDAASKPSLIEQLFPEETKRYEEEQRKASREIPRLPLDATPIKSRLPRRSDTQAPTRSRGAAQLYETLRSQDAVQRETTILILRNASTNLVEDDFRRLVPSGQHLEGWTLEQGDILKVIPGRNLANLEQQNVYYLLFSSKLSAFAYQGHVTRIHRLVQAHTPSSLASPMAPPPGYVVEGLDAHQAMENFSLIPASQTLDLRQLRPPLTPLMSTIARFQGYSAIVRRPDKMPYEVRFTLDGPQLQVSTIRHILLQSGKDRSLPWSGGDETLPRITKWEPKTNLNPNERHSGRVLSQIKEANERSEEEQMVRDFDKLQGMTGPKEDSEWFKEADGGRSGKAQDQKRRAPQIVYVLGFHTEAAAQRFVQYWHRRPMSWRDAKSREMEEDDLPPIANAEILW